MSYSSMSNNTAESGGALAVQQYSRIDLSNLILEVNHLKSNASVSKRHCAPQHELAAVLLIFDYLQGNNASKYGGAIYSMQPTISIADRDHLDPSHFTIGNMQINNATFSTNWANSGGSIYVLGNGANVTVVSSRFTG